MSGPWRIVPLLLVSACSVEGSFRCAGDSQCSSSALTGTCESSGYCSFGDPGCASGRRYGTYAGGALGGQCVDDGTPDGGTGDGSPPAFAARVISSAYYTDWNGTTTYEYPSEMSKTGYQIGTTGVVDGDLLLFIASVDNGSATVWPNPVAPGFTQLAQNFYGNDGQSYVVAWKIASGEPAAYAGSYGPGIGSSSAVLHLIAVSGANLASPINDFRTQVASGAGTDPVVAASLGVTPSVPGCLIIYASGVDWESAPGSNTFTRPSGYDLIAQLGDRGDSSWDWTSQQIDSVIMAGTGPTGSISGSFDGTHLGSAWTAVIAVAPR